MIVGYVVCINYSQTHWEYVFVEGAKSGEEAAEYIRKKYSNVSYITGDSAIKRVYKIKG